MARYILDKVPSSSSFLSRVSFSVTWEKLPSTTHPTKSSSLIHTIILCNHFYASILILVFTFFLCFIMLSSILFYAWSHGALIKRHNYNIFNFIKNYYLSFSNMYNLVNVSLICSASFVYKCFYWARANVLHLNIK